MIPPVVRLNEIRGMAPIPLHLLSWIYGALMRGRAAAYRKAWIKPRRLPCAVISVGNIAVGGTGKTPMIQHLAETLTRSGLRTAIVSRGYKSAAENRGGWVGDGDSLLMDVFTAGDEPFLLASTLTGVPVLIGKDRHRMGMEVVRRFSPDVILLDDGFQHLRLHRDMDLALLDARSPFGNGYGLPRGDLREMPGALGRAHALVLTRWEPGVSPISDDRRRFPRNLPVFRARHAPHLKRWVGPAGRPAPSGAGRLQGRRVLVFSGIARPEDFPASVRSLGAEIVGCRVFGDHHWYDPTDIKRLLSAAEALQADALVTTEKDWVRLAPLGAAWPVDLAVLGVAVSFDPDETRFHDWLLSRLRMSYDSHSS